MVVQPVINAACHEDLADLAPLFDRYRQFYGYAADPVLAERFLQARIGSGDSRLFLARDGGQAVGFAQCYPGLSSLECRPSWLLGDLFVEPAARRQGVARALLEAVRDAAKRHDCCLVELFTARSNSAARRLYQEQGYVEDEQFLHYELLL